MSANGLGAWWFPAPLRRWLTNKSGMFFRDAAWETHDMGYGRGSPSRKECDRKFLQAMLLDASHHDRPVICALLALTFWACVRVGGRWSYDRG